MKRIILAASLSVILFSCSSREEKTESISFEQQRLNMTEQELRRTVAAQDSLLALVNEISDGMNRIKAMEQIISVNSSIEGAPDMKESIVNDMIVLQQALQQRRLKLEELEKSLKSQKGQNSNLLKTVETLKSQISEQQQEINSLNSQLEQANIKIAALDDQIEQLNTEVSDINAQKEQAQQEAVKLTDELNTCYYAIGSSKELKENNIMKTGFLRKTKILPGDFDRDFFTQADKRTLTKIQLHSKKAEVLTNQSAGSYEIVDENGQKVLRITQPEKFWELTNFLVVKID